MDVLVELLPPNFTVKTEPSAKEKRRQKSDGKKTAKAPASEQNQGKVTTKALPALERRTGEERRQQKLKRGRWLDSRDRNDRRATALTVFVKV